MGRKKPSAKSKVAMMALTVVCMCDVQVQQSSGMAEGSGISSYRSRSYNRHDSQ